MPRPQDHTLLPTLRFMTCGSVDDGKSTLIGRLLYEQKLIADDQLFALARDSRRHGTTGDDIDFALLVDGLEAEREQGITIDVAYRYFSTPRRTFIVADTPGHQQYTRNMATGASNADVAVVLVDARKGLLTQTFRHSFIVSLLGIRHVFLAINKVDLVDFDQSIFDAITRQYHAFATRLSFATVTSVPISARFGDNISSLSNRTPWYTGPHLLALLESIEVETNRKLSPFRMPIQWVNRPHLDFRGYSGTIVSGEIHTGSDVVVANSGSPAKISRIVAPSGEVDHAEAGDAVTITLDRETDVARGDVISEPTARPEISDQFTANVIWMSTQNLYPGRSYLLKSGGRTASAAVTELKHRVDVNSLEKLAARSLSLNEVGVCNIATASPLAFDPYNENRETGAFILIDRITNETVAAGMIVHGLRRATNIHRQNLAIDKIARAAIKNQRPAILWFTGLPGSGKSTIANIVEQRLHARGLHTTILDGDNVRFGLTKDLGFTPADRVENIRRVVEVARLMTEAGLIVICSFISPFESERTMARERATPGEFIEIFVDAPLEEVIARDPKGLYKKALKGEIKNFTGVDQPYERPSAPELILKTAEETPEKLADFVIKLLEKDGFIAER
jgi:bifunctional enzyme CysN/CysC